MANSSQATRNPTNTSLTEEPVSRRSFLSLAWKSLLGLSGILCLGGLWRYFSYQPYPVPPTTFDLGPIEDLPTDAILTVSEAQATLVPTPNGFQAFSLVCPHLGCEVEPVTNGFTCPCHGSRFGFDGSVETGPADRPLRSLRLELTEERHLLLDITES